MQMGCICSRLTCFESKEDAHSKYREEIFSDIYGNLWDDVYNQKLLHFPD